MSSCHARSPAENEVTGQAALDIGPRALPPTREVQRLPVVVSEELRVIRDAPAGRCSTHRAAAMCFSAAGRTRDLLVGDVADERVPEGEFVLAAQSTRRGTGRTNSRRTSSRSSRRVTPRSRSPTAATAPLQKTRPSTERPATRLFSSGRSVSSRAAISACTVSGMAPCRRRRRARRACGELLGVERVSARALEQHRLRLGGHHRPLEQEMQEAAVLVPTAATARRRRIALPPAPARTCS